ncbi:hypothetical protein KIW84_073202 [Lathyrus oleraceus]|uniref:Uncharacterized protein n=1 Tax=Pisum sativum TaxID=3888 RepID=A0A9D4VQM6_PEA|nr:hypothetical protein KIW84_073202 [Pisum sativum]
MFYRVGSETIVEGQYSNKFEKIANHNLGSNIDGHIWIKHGVEDMLSKVFKPYVNQSSECSDDDSTNNDDVGIRFDDSAEERTCEREEGFVQVEVERPISGNKVEVNGKSLRFKVMGSKHPKIRNLQER